MAKQFRFRTIWAAFELAFTRNEKGNLCRRIGATTLTVFFRPWDGMYGWSIANSRGKVTYSPGSFPTEMDAMVDLFETVNPDDGGA